MFDKDKNIFNRNHNIIYDATNEASQISLLKQKTFKMKNWKTLLRAELRKDTLKKLILFLWTKM